MKNIFKNIIASLLIAATLLSASPVYAADSTCAYNQHTFKLTKCVKATAKKKGCSVYTCTACGAQRKIVTPKKTAASAQALQDNAADETYTVSLGNGRTKKVTGHFDTVMSGKITKLLNSYRKRQGLSSLKTISVLTKAAKNRAVECAVKQSHTRPDGTICFTVDASVYAENLAWGYDSAQEVMDEWKQSADHDDNMLDGSYNTIGIAVFVCRTKAEDGRIKYTRYFVQLFGK